MFCTHFSVALIWVFFFYFFIDFLIDWDVGNLDVAWLRFLVYDANYIYMLLFENIGVSQKESSLKKRSGNYSWHWTHERLLSIIKRASSYSIKLEIQLIVVYETCTLLKVKICWKVFDIKNIFFYKVTQRGSKPIA